MRTSFYRKVIAGFLIILLFSTIFYQFIPSQAHSKDATEDDSSGGTAILYQNHLNESEIVTMIQKVNTTDIKKYLEKIVKFGPKWTGTKACDDAAIYIFDTFEHMGLTVAYQPWVFPFRRGKNVIAIQQGRDPTSDAIYLMCAHYDTWKTAPGADYDGSGIAAMLAIANITCRYSLNHTVCFLAVSGHECGPAFAYGSTYAAKNAYENKKNIMGVLDLDMIGNTSSTGNSLQEYAPARSLWLLDFIDQINEKYKKYFDITLERFPFAANADDGSFLDFGYDAMMFIQSNFWKTPNHVPEDDMRIIDLCFLTNVTKLVLAVTVELAEKPIDLQIQITNPRQETLSIFNKLSLKLPGLFNLRKAGLRGMTFILGRSVTVTVDIKAHDEIDSVWCILDDDITYERMTTKPPYEFILKKPSVTCRGKHTIGVQVVTQSGRTVYDEMNVYFVG